MPSSHRNKKSGSPAPQKEVAERRGSLEGPLPHILLSVLFLPSDKKIECILLSQRRGGPSITNALSCQVSFLMVKMKVVLCAFKYVLSSKVYQLVGMPKLVKFHLGDLFRLFC